MRVVFMGTPPLAATILEELAQHHEVVAVYTRPDAVRGRGKQLLPSPVKQVAERYGLTVRTPRTLRTEEELQAFIDLEPDALCVAAYGVILPDEILEAPRYASLNVHASLLPRWRGAAPVERAILEGDAEAGVTIMRIVQKLDSGDYCVSRSVPIIDQNAERLTDELANLGSQALLTALTLVESGAVVWTKQDESQVVYAHKIAKGELDPQLGDSALTIERKVRASSEAHPSRCVLAGRGVTLMRVRLLAEDDALAGENIEPGVVRWTAKRLLMGCADGPLEILEVKPDGKQAMNAAAFAAGAQSLRHEDGTWEGR